tara:strand:- start:88 stop:450 length:363 start_codon:yes stop_codon:yes gene_type:complete
MPYNGKYIPEKNDFYKLSRSKVDFFLNCSRYFYMDRRLGIAQPPGFPFNLNSAHISLEHTGEFEFETPTPEGVTFLSYEWLESAFLIKENGKLKFKFYFSEQINDRKNNLYRRHPLPINN